jgi:hypothetical protein
MSPWGREKTSEFINGLASVTQREYTMCMKPFGIFYMVKTLIQMATQEYCQLFVNFYTKFLLSLRRTLFCISLCNLGGIELCGMRLDFSFLQWL